jgi:hypothetical protein
MTGKHLAMIRSVARGVWEYSAQDDAEQELSIKLLDLLQQGKSDAYIYAALKNAVKNANRAWKRTYRKMHHSDSAKVLGTVLDDIDEHIEGSAYVSVLIMQAAGQQKEWGTVLRMVSQGYEHNEIAEHLGMAIATYYRMWRSIKLWLTVIVGDHAAVSIIV